MTIITLDQFECIGDDYAKKLNTDLNIRTVDDFYKCSFEEIREKTVVDEKRVQHWFDVLDLFRIPKISVRDAELLYYANVNSVLELSHRQASRIYYKFKETDVETYFIILALPTFAQIDEWIYFAKLMSRRIKFGLNIPLILLGLTMDQVTDLSKYRIWTVEDFVTRGKLISGLRGRLNLGRKEYKMLENKIDMLRIDGVDEYIARTLQNAGMESLELLKITDNNEILSKVQEIQAKEKNCPEKITIDLLNDIKNKIKNEEGK
ncbi:MAG: DUF4332 domain-containing protein [archaeon]|nr:DUF4332 domain-containing protein [archaeon]